MRLRLTLALAAALGFAPRPAAAAPIQTQYVYHLATSTGVIRSNGVFVVYDPYGKETITVGDGLVRIFNESGMEVYSFASPPELGGIMAVAPIEDGDMLFLAFSREHAGQAVFRANFRGEVKGKVELELPAEWKEFAFNSMGYGGGRLYLADLGAMRMIVTGLDGKFITAYDLAKLVDPEKGELKRQEYGLKGFKVNAKGEVLFTVQPLFKAYVLSPDGTFRFFGQRGSAPGKFNVVAGIAQDEKGYTYVTDILKSAVLVFDPDFKWVKEFGYRGGHAGALFAPVDIAAGDGKVYVSQYARRGVAVFKVTEPTE
jgi:hypothetical protein